MARISETVLNVIILFFFIFGTMSTMTSKLLFQFEGEGLNHIRHHFEKPLFQSTMMFVGMALCMFVYWSTKPRSHSSSHTDENKPLLPLNGNSPSATSVKATDPRVYYVVAVPALCDFLATYMMTIGLLWVSASVFQMIRGSIVLFSAIIRWGWLKKRIYNYQWFGVFVVMMGEVLVGYSAIAAGDSKSSSNSPTITEQHDLGDGIHVEVTKPLPDFYKIFGILLIFLAQLVQALQVVVEEHLLHNVNASAYLVVGLEGVWGLVLCCCVSAPLAYYIQTPGLHEDVYDTWAMMKQNPVPLIPVAVAYTLTILGFNLTAMKITEHINSVTRCVLDTVRTIFIWILMTICHYMVDTKYGEEWTSWSYVELVGFAVLMSGLFIYYQVLMIPALFEYPTETQAAVDPHLATPLLTPKQRQQAQRLSSTGRGKSRLQFAGPTNLKYTANAPTTANGSYLGDDADDFDDEGSGKLIVPVVSSPRI